MPLLTYSQRHAVKTSNCINHYLAGAAGYVCGPLSESDCDSLRIGVRRMAKIACDLKSRKCARYRTP